jgi:hypothetical protein
MEQKMTKYISGKFAVLAFLAIMTLAPSAAKAQASGTAGGDVTANSVTILDNSNNAITSFLFPDGQAWFSNNIWLGNSDFSYSTTAEYGPALFFGGATGDNTDVIAMYRYNKAPNITEFRLSIGDDVTNPSQCDASGNCITAPDTFVIGGTDVNNGNVWTPRFTFTTTGYLGVDTTTPQATVDINGQVRVADGNSTCDSTRPGAIRFNATTKVFEGCDGTKWYPFGSSPTGGIYTVHFLNTPNTSPLPVHDCRYPNPLTGSCTCPAGYTAYQFHDFITGCETGFYRDNSQISSGICGVLEFQCILTSAVPAPSSTTAVSPDSSIATPFAQ